MTDDKFGKWISVKDRLPEDYEEALMLVYSPFVWRGLIYSGFHHSEIPQWTTADMTVYKDYKYNRVTHWMPLPKPPEEQQ